MLEDFHDRGIYLTEEEYSTGLRTLFPNEYDEYSDEELEDILYDRIALLSPLEAEGFFSSVGDFLRNNVAPVALGALPAITTIAGTAFGGPIGAAAGNALGGLAANALSGATHIRPNPVASNIGRAATSIAGGNIQGAIPNFVNASRGIGNAISPGSGNRVGNIASGIAQGASAIAGRNYQGAIPGFINAGRDIGNMISPGAGNNIANVAQSAQGLATGLSSANPANQQQALTQLLSFIQSTPFLQTLLSSVATGNINTAVHIPTEDGNVIGSNYLEMLESLKFLTENAIIEADNAGFPSNLQIESEADRDSYLEALIGNVNEYENSLLPDYNSIAY